MNDIEKTQLVFSGIRVEYQDQDIVVDNILRICPCKMQIRTIGGLRNVDGYQIVIENEDADEVAQCRTIEQILIEASKWYYGWKTEQILAQVDCQEFANQLEQEELMVIPFGNFIQ